MTTETDPIDLYIVLDNIGITERARLVLQFAYERFVLFELGDD